jgi:hypothetical protein
VAEKFSMINRPKAEAGLVFVFEPEEYLLDLYCKYLLQEKYAVKGFRDLDMAVSLKGEAAEPDVAVINTGFLQQPNFRVFRSRTLPDRTKIISIGSGVDAKFVGNLMSLGVSSHLERRLSRPGDLVEIVRALIYH